MAHQINEKCESCGECRPACPVTAIQMGRFHFEIDPEYCVDCGDCTKACPVKAIQSNT